MLARLLTLLVVLPAVFAQDAPERLAQDSGAIERFGALPIRFNGTLTTYAEYARSLLLASGSGTEAARPDGSPLHPTEWLLRVLSTHHERLEDRYISADLGDLSPVGPPYSFGFVRYLAEHPEEDDPAAQAFFPRADVARQIGNAYEPQVLVGDSRALEYSRFLNETLLTGFPQDCPLPDKKRWTNLPEARLMDTGGAFAQGLSRLLRTHKDEGTSETFLAHLAEYETLVEPWRQQGAPLRFEPIPGWIQTGTAGARWAWFGDTGGWGVRAASFRKLERAGQAGGGLVLHWGPTKTDAELFATWRLEAGSLPESISGAPLPETT